MSNNYGLHGTGFIGLGKNYNKWMYRVRRHVFLKKIKDLNIESSQVDILDIGSGTGFYISLWKELMLPNVTGCDLTKTAVTNLKAKFPDFRFLEFDIGDDTIPISEKFDIISAFDVLFHIVDDTKYLKALENIKNLLKPGGIFIFSENFVHDESKYAKFQTTRSLKEIQGSLENLGFIVLERSPMFFLMNAPVDSKNRLLNKMWRMITKNVSRGEKFGLIIGTILFPLEIFIISITKESPTTEIMICKNSQ
ncbi:class I SAM-dependent DNA methyltransferase [Candidatus Nitrosocosmicus sp. R]